MISTVIYLLVINEPLCCTHLLLVAEHRIYNWRRNSFRIGYEVQNVCDV